MVEITPTMELAQPQIPFPKELTALGFTAEMLTPLQPEALESVRGSSVGRRLWTTHESLALQFPEADHSPDGGAYRIERARHHKAEHTATLAQERKRLNLYTARQALGLARSAEIEQLLLSDELPDEQRLANADQEAYNDALQKAAAAAKQTTARAESKIPAAKHNIARLEDKINNIVLPETPKTLALKRKLDHAGKALAALHQGEQTRVLYEAGILHLQTKLTALLTDDPYNSSVITTYEELTTLRTAANKLEMAVAKQVDKHQKHIDPTADSLAADVAERQAYEQRKEDEDQRAESSLARDWFNGQPDELRTTLTGFAQERVDQRYHELLLDAHGHPVLNENYFTDEKVQNLFAAKEPNLKSDPFRAAAGRIALTKRPSLEKALGGIVEITTNETDGTPRVDTRSIRTEEGQIVSPLYEDTVASLREDGTLRRYGQHILKTENPDGYTAESIARAIWENHESTNRLFQTVKSRIDSVRIASRLVTAADVGVRAAEGFSLSGIGYLVANLIAARFNVNPLEAIQLLRTQTEQAPLVAAQLTRSLLSSPFAREGLQQAALVNQAIQSGNISSAAENVQALQGQAGALADLLAKIQYFKDLPHAAPAAIKLFQEQIRITTQAGNLIGIGTGALALSDSVRNLPQKLAARFTGSRKVKTEKHE